MMLVTSVLASVDNVARVLGGIGTVAGVVAALIAVLSYHRDRPQLKITWQLEFESATAASLGVHVVNDGRQPIAIAGTEVQNFNPPNRGAYARIGK